MKFILKKIFLWILKFLKIKDRNSSSEKLDNSKNETTIQILPNEILSQVFEYLNIQDVIKCYETSQRWSEVAKLRLYHYLKKPNNLQVVSKHDLENLEVFSNLNEDRTGGILICMPNGMYVFGGSESSQNPFRNGPITSKFLGNGSKVWRSGPNFPHKMYPRPRSIHDYVRDFNTFEFSGGHKISTQEFIVVVNRHVFKYDVESKNWSYFVKLKHSRRRSCSIVFDGKLIITGGHEFPHGNALHTTEIVDLSSRKAWIGGDNYNPRVGFKMDICILDDQPRIVAYYGNRSTYHIEIWNENSQSWKIRRVSSTFCSKISAFFIWLERNKGRDRLDKIFLFKNSITKFVPLNAFYVDRKKAIEFLRKDLLRNLTHAEFEDATKDILKHFYWDFEFEV